MRFGQLEPCLDAAEIWRSSQGTVLLLGGARHAAAAIQGLIPELDVTHVVCVASSRNARTLAKMMDGSTANVVFQKFPMDDMIHTGQIVDIESFSSQLEAIQSSMCHAGATKRPRAVLVHCDLGVNRSPTLVLAFLIHTGMSLRQAYHHVLSTRPFVDPLPGYREALMRYEMKLSGKCTVSKDEPFNLHLSELLELARQANPPAGVEAETESPMSACSTGSSCRSESEAHEDAGEAHERIWLDAAVAIREDSIRQLLAEVMPEHG